MSAAEIRKRLAQYYNEPRHRDQIRIELPMGSYIPAFHWPEGNPPAATVALEPLPPGTGQPFFQIQPQTSPSPAGRNRKLVIGGATALVAAAIAGFLMWPESALDSFWRPVLVDPQPILYAQRRVPSPPANPWPWVSRIRAERVLPGQTS